MPDPRTSAQVRFGTLFHEASHAVAHHLLGHAIVRIEVFAAGADRKDGDEAGCVWALAKAPTNVHEAEDMIVTYLAGEAGLRVAWALETISNDQIGGTAVPTEEISIDDVLAIPTDATLTERFSYYGYLDVRGKPDELEAIHLAEQWTASAVEAVALMNYCRARTASLVATDQFQNLMHALATALTEHTEITGEMDGHLATDLLRRADESYRNETEERGGTKA